MTTETVPPGMLLYGLKAISTFMGVRPRQAQHLVETNQIPHFHMGRVICADRATLTAALKARAAANPAKAEDSAPPVFPSTSTHPSQKGPRHVR